MDGKGGLFGNVDLQSCHAAHLKTHANAHAERFVRSIKESCLERLILFGESSLRTAIQNFVAHYHQERNHQGLSNRLIQPESDHLKNTGAIQRRERLGGMLNYYYRTAA
jgi:putative transposase